MAATVYSRTSDGQPLAGVSLAVTFASAGTVNYVTGSDGSVLVSGPAGRWSIDFAKTGYATEGAWQGSVLTGDGLFGYLMPLQNLTDTTMPAPPNTSGQTSTGAVTATVYSRTSDGQPLAGVSLAVTFASGGTVNYVTGSDGSVLVSGPAGRWSIEFAKAGYEAEGVWQGSVLTGDGLFGYLLPG